MADNFLVKFKLDLNNLNSAAVGTMTLDKVRDMTLPEFIEFQGRLLNLEKRRRYDTAHYKSSIAITPAHTKSLFRTGVNEVDAWANDDSDPIRKTLAHTNMPRKGEWQPGEVAIIHRIEAVSTITAGKPAASNDGIVSDPAVTAFPTNIDVFLMQQTIGNQFGLRMVRGNKQTVAEGRVVDFPQASGISGVGGAAPGAFSQNMAFAQENLLVKPQVIEGKEDFEIQLEPLAPSLSMVAAARDIRIEVRLSTWEFIRFYA